LFGVREPSIYRAVGIVTGNSILFAPQFPIDYAVWLGKLKTLSYFKERYMVSMVYYIYIDNITRVFFDQFQDYFTTKYQLKTKK